jgi:SpoIID/LytB domain protein
LRTDIMRSSLARRLQRGAAAAILSLLVALLPAIRADAAEPSITFDGAGWGHGVGMSQYGAYGRALDGQTHEEILADYYQGATIGQFGVDGVPALDNVVTNVASDITSTTLTVFDGPGTPRTGMVVTRITGVDTQPSATLQTGDTITIVDTTPLPGNPHGCEMTLVIDGETTVWEAGICDLDVELTAGPGTPTNLVRATNCRRSSQCTYGYGSTFRLVDNGSAQRTVGSTTYYDKIGGSGCQACAEYQGFDLVVVASPDDYTRGIAEMPFSWGVNASAALRTQAIAARSYAASFAVSTDHRTVGCFCDVKNDSSYQVFAGWIGGWPENQRWDDAATATNGQVLVHPDAPDQDIVRAYYSSSNGGASEAVEEKWGTYLPYLRSIDDPWSLEPPNPLRSWSEEVDADTVVDRIWGTSSSNVLTGAEVTARNTSGSAKTIRFEARTPSNDVVTKSVPVGTVQSRFGLNSWYFDIDDSGVAGGTPPPTPTGGGVDGVAMQDPTTGIWSLRDPNGVVKSFYFGNPRDIPFIGDWNGDGVDTVGLYRESTGYLFLRNSNTQGIADIEIYYGDPGDLPVAGDWDGDGDDTVGIYRRSDNSFYLRNSNTQGIADIVVPLGDTGDVPVAGDWNGDGSDSVGVYRPATKTFYFINDVDNPTVDFIYVYDGASSVDDIVVGDWDGDGDDTVGVFRSTTAFWYLRDTFEQEVANIVFEFGDGRMNPIAGYWGG